MPRRQRSRSAFTGQGEPGRSARDLLLELLAAVAERVDRALDTA